MGKSAMGAPSRIRALAGVDLKTAQARLGHSTPTLTLGVYAQVSEEADRDAADELGARWIGPRDGRAMERDRRDRQASS